MDDNHSNDAGSAAPAPEAEAPARRHGPPRWLADERRRLDRTDAWLLLGLVVVSLAIHLIRLGSPGALLPDDHEQCTNLPPLEGSACHKLIPLDEVHYVPDARDVLLYGTASDQRVPEGEGKSGRFVVHPPVGKWFIAAGIWLFGDHPFGWRFFGALFGGLSSAIVYVIARRLWAARWAAVLAGGLLSIEGLWFVQSRVAMLDIYASAFLLLGVWLLLEDRNRTGPEHVGVRWYRIGGAFAFALAFASKWSVAPIIAMVAGMALAWEVARVWGRSPRRLMRTFAAFGVTFVVLPSVVYLATYIPWAINDNRYAPGDCLERGTVLSQQACYHRQMINFHRNLQMYEEVDPPEDEPDATPSLKPNHPYFGYAWSWPWIGRPVAHHFETIGEGDDEEASEVLGLPNPAIWWVAFAFAIPALVVWTIRRGDQVAPLLLGIIMAGWGPYLLADAIDRPVFLFYATPIVPFLVLAVVHLWVRIVHRWSSARWAVATYAAVALMMFAYFYPVIAAHPIPRRGAVSWEARMWFNGPVSDCLVVDRIKIRCWI